MSSEIKGYYKESKKSLLDSFDQTIALMGEPLTARYGTKIADTLQKNVRLEYEKLIPESPYIRGDIRTKMLNFFLIITAQELAVYKALKKHGKSPAEAFELCDEALRHKLAKIPVWQRSSIRRLMFSGFTKRLFNRRSQKTRLTILVILPSNMLVAGDRSLITASTTIAAVILNL